VSNFHVYKLKFQFHKLVVRFFEITKGKNELSKLFSCRSFSFKELIFVLKRSIEKLFLVYSTSIGADDFPQTIKDFRN